MLMWQPGNLPPFKGLNDLKKCWPLWLLMVRPSVVDLLLPNAGGTGFILG